MLTAGNGLQAQYFGDASLTEPSLVRIDSAVDFDWASGSPDASIDSDVFSVRWSGEIESRYTETHSFILNANGGARLYVNGELLVDQLDASSLSDETATIDLIAGRRYDVQLEYVETDGDAGIKLEWSSDSQTREVVPATRLYAGQRGSITAQTFSGITGSDVADLTGNLNFPDSPNAIETLGAFESPTNSGNNFGRRIVGFVHAPTTGPYTFYLAADESAELWLSNTEFESGKALIASVDSATDPQEWDADPSQRSVTVYLAAGQKYFIEALHKESTAADHLSVGWIKPGSDSIELVSGEYLSPATPTVQIFTDNPRVAEDSSLPVSFQVTRTGPTTNALDVSFITFGDAVEGVDYEATNGFITIPAGERSIDIEIFPVVDSDAEGNESLNVELIAGAGYEVGFRSQRTAYGELQDDVDAPAGGTSLWSGDALSDFDGFGGSFSTVNDPTFGNVIQAVIPGTHNNPFSAQLRQNIEAPVNEGDILWVEFRVRSVGGDGEISAIFEKASAPFTKSLTQGISFSEDWQTIQIPFTAVESYDAGEASFGFHLGHIGQTLQFTDFTVSNYGPSRSVSPQDDFTLNTNGSGTYGNAQYVSVTGQSFISAYEVETTTIPANPWFVQAVDRNEGVVADGDTLRFEFYVRAVDGVDPVTTFALQRTDNFATLFSQNISLTDEWQQLSFDVPVSDDFESGGLQAVFNVGQKIQTVQIGQFTWSNLDNAVNIEELPSRFPSVTYEGREGTDVWRADADQQIDNNRQSQVTITVNDVNGNPVDGAFVSLRQIEHEFLFGSAINAFDGKLDPNGNETDLRYQSEINRLFNAAVLENSQKWGIYENDVERARQGADFAIDNDLYLRGHNLIWPSREFMPASVWAEYDSRLANDGEGSANAWLTVTIEDRFDTLLNEFDGQISEWDVVNEPWSNHDVMDILGDNIVIDWYQRVRDFDPNIKLTLNDFGIFASNGGDTGHRDDFDYWLGLLNDEGLLDVIGEQSHYSDSNLTDISVFADLLDEYSTEFDAPIAITEFDVNTKDQQLQADYLRDYITVAFSNSSVTEFLQWGFWESSHWLPDAALYNSDFSIKPNGQVYEDLVFGEWWTDLQGTTRNGELTTDAFRGDYEVVVQYDGQTYNATVTVDDSGNSNVTIDLPVSELNYDPILSSDSASVAGVVAGVVTNSGTWHEPDQQAVSLSASHGVVSLNDDGTWDWSYTPGQSYFAETVTITGLDSEGGTSQTTFAVSAIDLSVNGAQVQRSTVDRVVLTFDGSVEIDSGAFSVIQRSDANGTATSTPVAVNFTCSKDGDTTVTLEFDSLTRNGSGALEDGNYELTVDGTKIRQAGTDVTLGAEFVYGDSIDESFFALYGDSNGDRLVNVVDLLDFRRTFLASTVDTNYNSSFDYNGDGIINVVDLLQFRNNFLHTLDFV